MIYFMSQSKPIQGVEGGEEREREGRGERKTERVMILHTSSAA